MKRISYKKVNDFCSATGFSLVKHQWLGKNDYFYNYSLLKIKNEEYIVILKTTSLKAIYEWLLNNAEKNI